HALICVLGFAVSLPAGAILARYFRTSRPWWYKGHWITQVGIAGPIIVLGVSLGFINLGYAVFFLYVGQCQIGAVIHFFKPKNAKRRPIQNHFHAILGLTTLALGMYQIRTGYAEEWPKFASLGPVSSAVDVLWILWCILLVGVYAVGLVYIRKQYAQESAGRRQAETAYVASSTRPSYNMDIMSRKPGQSVTV
ncbi:hypothetical protein B0H12DRAFT_1258985, partial [Mycena haematopus]